MAVYFHQISEDDFNEKYKNRLRDFFVYQYKDSTTYYKTKRKFTRDGTLPDENATVLDSTLGNDSVRLQRLLNDALGVEWIGKNKRKKTCIQMDSRKIKKNPFFELYRTCLQKDKKEEYAGRNYLIDSLILMFFYSLTNLDSFLFEILVGMLYLSPEEENLLSNELREEVVNAYYSVGKGDRAIRGFEDLDYDERKKYFEIVITQLSRSFPDNPGFIHDQYVEALYNRLLLTGHVPFLEDSGEITIGKVKNLPVYYKCITYMLNTLLGTDSEDSRLGDDAIVDELNELVTAGVLNNDRGLYSLSMGRLPNLNTEGFVERFSEMIRLFSEIDALGVIGDSLLRRLKKENSALAFKHNYFLKALNAYNTIDLLYALNNEKWIKIEYRGGKTTGAKYSEVVCFPLAIKENAGDGRQYIIYYDPKLHSVCNKRVEFIDGIIFGDSYNPPSFIEDELAVAKKRVQYSWNIATPMLNGGNAKYDPENPNFEKTGLHEVKIEIEIEKTKEPFVFSRIVQAKKDRNKDAQGQSVATRKVFDFTERKENGVPVIEITANVTEPNEIINWIRTFTKRIINIYKDGEEYTQFDTDILAIEKAYKKPESVAEMFSDTKEDNDKIRVSGKDIVFVKDNKVVAPHRYIFNKVQSKRFEELTAFLLDIISLIEPDIDQIESAKAKVINNSGLQKKDDAVDYNLLQKQLSFFANWLCSGDEQIIYGPVNCTLYDLVPVSAIEIDWILYCLKQPQAQLFLTRDEIAEIKKTYQFKTGTFGDRILETYNQNKKDDLYSTDKVQETFRILLAAIYQQKKLHIQYLNWMTGEIYDTQYSPVSIEYSKRDDAFRLWAITNSGELYPLNLERIVDAKITNIDYDSTLVEAQAEKEYENREKKVQVIFPDKKNVPDRILTEFSPWKKKCKYDAEKKLYTMDLFYDKMDAFEIAIRLHAYGRNVYVVKDDGDVLARMLENIGMQKDIIDRKRGTKTKSQDGKGRE